MPKCNRLICNYVRKKAEKLTNKMIDNTNMSKLELYEILVLSEDQLNKCNECVWKRCENGTRRTKETRWKVTNTYIIAYYKYMDRKIK